jgi:uncharacterized RDD family membrane protein YckC
MEWYYADGALKVGPISEEELDSRVARGLITSTMLVWQDGMEDWKPLAEARPGSSRAAARDHAVQAGAGRRSCSQCGRSFSADEVIQLGGTWVCAACKPAYFQMLKEGAQVTGTFRYGGFWIRALALFLDGLIFGIPVLVVSFLVLIPAYLASAGSADPGQALGWVPALQAFMYIFMIALTVWFWGRFGATPGKMICGLKIVMSDGGKMGYGRALGRYFAQFLSYMILYIGVLMAAFDEQKRALHDRICDTRVIRTR